MHLTKLTCDLDVEVKGLKSLPKSVPSKENVIYKVWSQYKKLQKLQNAGYEKLLKPCSRTPVPVRFLQKKKKKKKKEKR